MAILIPEEVEAATAVRAWIARGLPIASTLVQLLFGHKPSSNEVANQGAPWVTLMAGPVHAIDRLMTLVVHDVESTYNTLVRVNNRIGDAYNKLARLARLWDAQLRTHFDAQITYVNNRVGDAYNKALRVTSGWVAAEQRTRAAQVAFLDNRIGQAYNELRALASTWVNDLRRETAAQVVRLDHRIGDAYNRAIAQAATWAQDAQRNAIGTVTRQVVQPTRATWPVMVTELAAATDAAGTELPGLRALIAAVPKTGPATLSEAATDPLAITRVLTRAMTDCTIPNCRNLSKYGRDLHGLGDLLAGAGLLAFLAYAVAHPDEAVRDTEAVAGGIISDVTHATRDLLGV